MLIKIFAKTANIEEAEKYFEIASKSKIIKIFFDIKFQNLDLIFIYTRL